MDLNFAEVEEYLSNVKKAVKEGRYEIERNANREANSMLFRNYLISEEDAKKIIYNLTPMDFSEAVRNRKPQYADEILYIFGKEVKLLERYGDAEKEIELYIKFKKESNDYVIVISFHEAKYPVKKYFH
ncbi:hypothetical protein ACW4V3_01500 [Faecalibacterium duncaniae]